MSTYNKHVYLQMCFLGQGSFGAVIHYQQLSTFKNVAVKILATNNGIRESKMLDKIKYADPDKNNLLKLVEHFSLGLQHCIVFEKLDQDVLHFMSKRNRKPMEVSEIRPIAQQILVALNALKSMGLAHTDIKPDNLMLVNHATHPFKVKLIDFGLARNISDLKRTSQIQALGYRAPEAVFGLPMNESVDLWSLGCSLVFMYFFKHLYPRTSEYEYIATIVRMHGTPPDHVLREGLRVHDFFSVNKTSSGNKFKFKIPTEYMGYKGRMTDWVFRAIGTIDNMLYDHKKCRYYSQMQSTMSHGDSLKLKDVTEFESLLKQMLCVNSKNRITPEEALKHNFISMNHLSKSKEHPYVRSAHRLMSVCQDTASGKSATSNNKTVCRETNTKVPALTAANLTVGKSATTNNKTVCRETNAKIPALTAAKLNVGKSATTNNKTVCRETNAKIPALTAAKLNVGKSNNQLTYEACFWTVGGSRGPRIKSTHKGPH
uniref:Protein kinase domain-containing protein n=1 Tax=Oryzias latipes TaxID=8090 RepID=A0A3P9K0J9_ORYLA